MVKRGSSQPKDAHTAVCVIGAGLSGLALALRLLAAGFAVTLIEARPAVGGLLRKVGQGDFGFEEGPAVLADAEPLRDLWRITGEDGDAELDLIQVDPVSRFLWSDGTSFDSPGVRAELVRQVARLAPADAAGLEAWHEWSMATRRDGWPLLAERFSRRPGTWGAMLAELRRSYAWRSAGSFVGGLVHEPHLRQALVHNILLSGGNPATASALVLAGQHLAGSGPAWWPRGGMARLAETLAARFEMLGGTLRRHDPVARIEAMGNRVSEVETLSGWRAHFAAVASAADAVHTYRSLLKNSADAASRGTKWAARRFSPSAVSVHFALAGTWPGIAHQTILIGPRFEQLLSDVFDAGVLPRDMLIWLHHPTVTDPDLAPPGHSLMRATVPVAHLGKLPIDWDTVGPMIAERVIAEIGRRLIPDIEDRILARHLTTPRDLALDLNLHFGSGWSFEPHGLQAGPTRLAHRDATITNLFFAGAATAPGAGVAGVLAGAKACAQRMINEVVP